MIQTTNQPLIMWLFQQFQTHPVWLWGNHQVSSCVLGKPYCGCLQLIHRFSWLFRLFRHIGFNTFFNLFLISVNHGNKKSGDFCWAIFFSGWLSLITDLTGRIGSPSSTGSASGASSASSATAGEVASLGTSLCTSGSWRRSAGGMRLKINPWQVKLMGH